VLFKPVAIQFIFSASAQNISSESKPEVVATRASEAIKTDRNIRSWEPAIKAA
jgi:hypothetical protein